MADRPTTRLRALLDTPGCHMAPGVADAMMARLVAQAGFPALYMTGNGTAATRLGVPDIGLLTMPEMVDNATRIADACDIPLIADCDDGYGNPFNVRRAVKAFERGGAAGVHIEDQVAPKRCGHMTGRRLIPAEEMAAKLKAATDARIDADFVLIARTDAIAVEGLEAALDRAALYREAGADVLFVEAPKEMAQLKTVCDRLGGAQLYNYSTSGNSPELTMGELAEIGYKLAIFPNHVLYAAIRGATAMLKQLHDEETAANLRQGLPTFAEYHAMLDFDRIQELEQRYAVAENRRISL